MSDLRPRTPPGDPRHPFEIAHGIISYPFPFSTGQVGLLTLPEKLLAEDAERLAEYIQTLATEESRV